MELAGPDVPLAFGPFPLLPEPPASRTPRKSASRRLLLSQGPSSESSQHAPSSPQPVAFLGGGIGPSVGDNWPPSRMREEATTLKNLERRVGAFRVNMRTSSGHLLKAETLLQGKDRLHEKTDPHALDNRLPLLRKILSHRPAVVSYKEESDTEWYTSDFISECLCWHNVYRQRHGVPPLSMCPDLCSYAQEWANTLAHTNTLRYRNGCRDVGQNVYCRLNTKEPGEVTGQQVASCWYAGCRSYNYLRESDVQHASVNTGHFTQMVWAGTCDVGIGIARSRGGKVMVVANYRPAGNYSGGFQENVQPPLQEVSSDGGSEYS